MRARHVVSPILHFLPCDAGHVHQMLRCDAIVLSRPDLLLVRELVEVEPLYGHAVTLKWFLTSLPTRAALERLGVLLLRPKRVREPDACQLGIEAAAISKGHGVCATEGGCGLDRGWEGGRGFDRRSVPSPSGLRPRRSGSSSGSCGVVTPARLALLLRRR